ncbi:transmembrane prolyl 4-hydroxylase-like [Mya arenaria]|uniref:transmembrane prolyl 4-hydroxylase-like n=1 Tax=Mya arenaria TaxID=6604 RepID=UPI0022E4DC86|nr:transmembrane prolyl 4-hydroxylase-like [Mya arenaria]
MACIAKYFVIIFLFNIFTSSVYLLDNDKRINDVKIIEDHEDAVVAHEKLKYHESAQKDIHDEGQEYDIDEIEQDNNDGLGDIDEIGDINGDEEEDEYQFPPLTRLDPEYVGQEVYLELVDGVRFRRITRAMKPPVFEIPGFLSDEECDYIIEAAKDNGLEMSALFGEDVEKQFDADLPLEKVTRVSQQTWLDGTHIGGEFWDRLQTRISKLTELPIDMIQRGEPMQVVSYKEGGHYHAHIDTVEYNDKPCCIQTGCGEKELTPEWKECCRLCRYATVLYYLQDVEDGGETAFPLADAKDKVLEEKFADDNNDDWHNLSYNCHNSSLVVKPKKGTAIMWYNHFVDTETGYLGEADLRSHHGGCDIRKGTKWIANNWISSVPFQDRFKRSLFYTGP